MRIDPANFKPEWSHTILLRGREWPLAHPDTVDAADDLPARRHRGLIHLPAMLWALAHRVIFGVTPTNELRASIRKVFAPSHRAIVEELDASELIDVFNTYVALQADFHQRTQDAILAATTDVDGSPIAKAMRAAGAAVKQRDEGGPMRYPISASGGVPDALRGKVRDNRKTEATAH